MTRKMKMTIYSAWRNGDHSLKEFAHGWNITVEQLERIIKDGDAYEARQ